jgi:hypothetical protein
VCKEKHKRLTRVLGKNRSRYRFTMRGFDDRNSVLRRSRFKQYIVINMIPWSRPAGCCSVVESLGLIPYQPPGAVSPPRAQVRCSHLRTDTRTKMKKLQCILCAEGSLRERYALRWQYEVVLLGRSWLQSSRKSPRGHNDSLSHHSPHSRSNVSKSAISPPTTDSHSFDNQGLNPTHNPFLAMLVCTHNFRLSPHLRVLPFQEPPHIIYRSGVSSLASSPMHPTPRVFPF